MNNDSTTPPAPRAPTADELSQLAAWLHEQGHDGETVSLLARDAFTAVYDAYRTDGPGYADKLISVVWPGGPSFFDVFIWKDGTIVRTAREYDEKACDRCGGHNGTYCFNCWRQWSKEQERFGR